MEYRLLDSWHEVNGTDLTGKETALGRQFLLRRG